MPTYRLASYGIQLSQALAEAAAHADVRQTPITCLEFRHPNYSVPIRLVNQTDDISVTHEAGAALNPGVSVEYLASRITVTVPEQSPGAGTPEIVITVAHLSGEVKRALDATRDTLNLWTVTERLYLSDDLTGPAILPPLQLTCTAVDFGGGPIAQIRCSYGDPARRATPKLTFRSSQYPGLVSR